MLNDCLSSPLVQRVGWALLHSVWQIAVIAGLYGLTAAALRRAAANTRYLAGCLALVLMVAWPVATVMLPPTRAGSPATPTLTRLAAAPIARPDLSPIPPQKVDAQAPNPGAPASANATSSPTRATAAATLAHSSSPPLITDRADSEASPAIVTSESIDIRSLMQPTLPWLVVAWLIGVAVLLLRHLGGWFMLHQLRRSGHAITTGEHVVALTSLATRLRVAGPVRLAD